MFGTWWAEGRTSRVSHLDPELLSGEGLWSEAASGIWTQAGSSVESRKAEEGEGKRGIWNA